MKRGNAVWYNIYFNCNVMYVPWITFLWLLICLNENERGSGVWYHISSYCKYSEENCSSWGELTDVSSTLLFHLQNYRTCVVPSHPQEFHTPESNLRSPNYRDASPKFAYLVLRNGLDWEEQSRTVLRHQTICLIFTVHDHDGNADSNRSGGKSSLDKSG